MQPFWALGIEESDFTEPDLRNNFKLLLKLATIHTR